MRFQCSFELLPKVFESHQFAIENLVDWKNKELARHEDADTGRKRRTQFHRDIYLSGLFLHHLSDHLPKLVAEMYHPESTTIDRLIKELQCLEKDSSATQKTSEGSLEGNEAESITPTESQWQRLEALLDHMQQSRASEQAELVTMLGQLDERQQRFSGELDHLATRADSSSVVTNMEADDVSQEKTNTAIDTLQHSVVAELKRLHQTLSDIDASVASGTDAMNTASLNSIESNQQMLMQELTHVKRHLSKISKSIPKANMETEEVTAEKDTLDTQLERAKRVKSKGIW